MVQKPIHREEVQAHKFERTTRTKCRDKLYLTVGVRLERSVVDLNIGMR